MTSLSCLSVRGRKQMKASWVAFIYYPLLFLCLSWRAMCCNTSSGKGYSNVVRLHCSGQYSDWRVLWLARSQTAGQYFQRPRLQCLPWKMSSFPLPPLTPKAQKSAQPLLSCVSLIPHSISNHLANFSQRGPPLLATTDTPITQFHFYFYKPQILAAPQWLLSSEWERNQPLSPLTHRVMSLNWAMIRHPWNNVSLKICVWNAVMAHNYHQISAELKVIPCPKWSHWDWKSEFCCVELALEVSVIGCKLNYRSMHQRSCLKMEKTKRLNVSSRRNDASVVLPSM